MKVPLHGIHMPHRKHTAAMEPVKLPTPQTVIIPMRMHIGSPATPIVKVGDSVCVGTLIAEAGSPISANIHSSISGTVKKIEPLTISDGNACEAITIESDGHMTVDPAVCPPTIDSKESLIAAIKASGIVGLGGAGFPTYFKLNVDAGKVRELIINGAECEPYITSDTRTMLDRAADIKLAIVYLKQYLNIPKIIIAVEKNNPQAIRSMQALAADDSAISVKVLPDIYPQGGEKVLVYHTTGKTVANGQLPIDVGCLVSNCTTMADIGNYIQTGMPLVEKCITVDGSAVKNPMNVIAPLGTRLSEVFDFTGGFRSDPYKILYGGPMMGIAVPDATKPVLKQTNAILAFNKREAILNKPQPCIKCGNCINVCPFGINPPALARALREHDIDNMKKYGGEVCMECGCCSFVCPSNRPLVQNNRTIKSELAEYKAKNTSHGGNK